MMTGFRVSPSGEVPNQVSFIEATKYECCRSDSKVGCIVFGKGIMKESAHC